MKKIAQRCPNCKEGFITPKRLTECPFCGAVIPAKQAAQATEYMHQTSKEYAVLEKANKLLTEQLKVLEAGSKLKTSDVEPSTDVIKEFLTVNDEVQQIYNMVYGFLSKNNELLKSKRLTSETLCDFGFFCREMSKIFDELRKEANARQDLCGQIIAYRLVQASINDPSLNMKVRGQFSSGTPNVKMQAALPTKFTDDYYKITDFLNVPREVAASGVLRLDWKQVTEFITGLMNDGKPIPEGFGKQYPVYVTTYRRAKGGAK